MDGNRRPRRPPLLPTQPQFRGLQGAPQFSALQGAALFQPAANASSAPAVARALVAAKEGSTFPSRSQARW